MTIVSIWPYCLMTIVSIWPNFLMTCSETQPKFKIFYKDWTSLQVKLLDPLVLVPECTPLPLVLRCVERCPSGWPPRCPAAPSPGSGYLRSCSVGWRCPSGTGRRCPQRRRLPGRVTPALKKELVERGTSANKAWYRYTLDNLDINLG